MISGGMGGRIVLSYLAFIVVLGLCSNILAKKDRGWLSKFDPNEIVGTAKIFSPPGTPAGDGRVFILGSDNLGRDVLSRVLHGISPAVFIGILSTVVALLIGVLLGGVSGYYGDKLKLKTIPFAIAVVLWVLLVFESSVIIHTERSFGGLFSSSTAVITLVLCGLLATVLLFRNIGGKSMRIPVDSFYLKLIEIKRAIPTLMLLVVLFGVVGRVTAFKIALILGVLTWTSISRVTRAQVMRYKGENFVAAARILGHSDRHIFFRQIMPNIISVLLVIAAFNIASVILLESTLSFLGIGLEADIVSLGRLLAQSREYFKAWWVVLPPGLLIFSMIFCINFIADRLYQED